MKNQFIPNQLFSTLNQTYAMFHFDPPKKVEEEERGTDIESEVEEENGSDRVG